MTFETLETRRMLAFGVTFGTTPTGQPTYVIDNGADLKFSVIRGGPFSSTIHLVDISSVQYTGVFVVGFLGALVPEKQVAALVGDNSLLSNLAAS